MHADRVRSTVRVLEGSSGGEEQVRDGRGVDGVNAGVIRGDRMRDRQERGKCGRERVGRVRRNPFSLAG